jgi:hypothetical protein
MRFVNLENPVNRGAGLNRGLVAWWKVLPGRVGGTVQWLDLCHQFPGTLTASPTWSADRHPGGYSSLQFNGTSQYVVLPSGIEAPLTATGEASVVLWLKRLTATPASGTQSGFIRLTNTTTSVTSSHYPWTDGVGYISTFATARQTITLSAAVTRTNWHQVAVTAKAGTNNWVFYQNDIAVHTASVGSSSLDETNGLWIARSHNPAAGPYYFQGWIDSVRLYDRALSATEVRNAYLAARTGWNAELNWVQRRAVTPEVAAAGTTRRRDLLLLGVGA